MSNRELNKTSFVVPDWNNMWCWDGRQMYVLKSSFPDPLWLGDNTFRMYRTMSHPGTLQVKSHRPPPLESHSIADVIRASSME